MINTYLCYMPMLIYISSNDIFIDNPELMEDGRFNKLSSKEMKWVAHYSDFGSLYRKLPDDERALAAAEAAKLIVNGSAEEGLRKLMAPTNKGKIMNAVHAYGELQGNSVIRKSIDSVDKQIRNMQDIISKKASLEDSTHIKNWADSMNKYMDLREKLLNKLEAYNQERAREKRLKEEEEEAAKRLHHDADNSSILEQLQEYGEDD